MTAMEDLNGLLQALPGYAVLTDSMKTVALAGALVPDEAGVWPGESGYSATYDVYFAALTLLPFLQAQPVVRNSSSEGSSVSVDAPDWAGVATYYRSQSRICQAVGNGPLTKVRIPDGPHVVRTDMSGRGSYYGDVDTDVS